MGCFSPSRPHAHFRPIAPCDASAAATNAALFRETAPRATPHWCAALYEAFQAIFRISFSMYAAQSVKNAHDRSSAMPACPSRRYCRAIQRRSMPAYDDGRHTSGRKCSARRQEESSARRYRGHAARPFSSATGRHRSWGCRITMSPTAQEAQRQQLSFHDIGSVPHSGRAS